MTLRFQVEAYLDIEPELAAMYPEHYAELAVNKHRKKLSPDYERYRELAQAGIIHITTARVEATGALVGYFMFFIPPCNIHYSEITTAYGDIYFLRKPYRRGWNAMRFAQFMLESLKAIDVDEVYVATKLHADYGLIFERLGFAPIERVYTKLLDGSKNEGVA